MDIWEYEEGKANSLAFFFYVKNKQPYICVLFLAFCAMGIIVSSMLR